jgi:thymidylate synthase
MKAYIDIVQKVLDEGEVKENRTGVNTIAVPGVMFEHDMTHGFPLLTTKYMPIGIIAVELEMFIKGLTDKQWLQDRGCRIWDEWCNPKKVPYGHDKKTREAMVLENDLGPIYGSQWRNFGGVDQLAQLVDTIKTNPNDRRMIVSAWNPTELDQMALPPCHYGFQVTVINGRLNLLWNQRSVDVALGLPFNIASYGLLLMLLAKESGFKPGMLVGFLADTHIYENHIPGLKKQIGRTPLHYPEMEINHDGSIFEWEYWKIALNYYKYYKPIKFDIAV